MGHFYGRVQSWDVVNEALSTDCSGRMEDNVFLRKLGPGYVDDCFRVAHQVWTDPSADRLVFCVFFSVSVRNDVDLTFQLLIGPWLQYSSHECLHLDAYPCVSSQKLKMGFGCATAVSCYK